ncbi:MAG: DUF4239 domain-containing protein, partial [Candidatus Eremiobacteraeota bacterium]|nr:DUF4239 domain-containing protein [Candidatus Eremiobacteraeota bacterium]
VVLPAVAAALVHAAFRRIVPHERLIAHHDVAGFLVAIVGVLYAVVLGFVVVTSWSAFDSAQQNADQEAGDVADAFGFARMLPEPRRGDLQKSLAGYAIEVRDREWDAMRKGQQDPRARAFLLRAAEALGEPGAKPSANFDEALNRETARQAVAASLRDIADNRRLRLIESSKTFTPVLGLALIIGAAIVIAFVFLFGMEDTTLQLTMTALVAGCIGLLLGVVFEFSAPYAGALRVSADAWSYIIDNNHFRQIVRTSEGANTLAP